MGAGKTTVGRLLAQRLEWDFADSDHLMESQTGLTIADIFATQGEPGFRDLEAAAIRDNVTGERLVLALGGGALERRETRDLVSSLPDSVLIFLDAPLDVLVSRCSAQHDGPVRPVLADRARLEERWTRRLPGYRASHLTLNTEAGSPAEVAERIFLAIGDRCRETTALKADTVRKAGVPA
jgi:shikimate kinase